MDELLRAPLPEIPLSVLHRFLAERFALAGPLTALAGERDQNLLLEAPGARFAVKVANAAEPPAHLEMQQLLLEHLARTDPGLGVPRVRRTVDEAPVAGLTFGGREHAVRVLRFLPGRSARDAGPLDPRLLGRWAARLQRGLRGFFHPAAGRALPWDLRRAPALAPDVPALEGAVRDVVGRVLDRFERELLPDLPRFPAQVVHHDLNPDNLLVDATGTTITGTIDFGDALHAPRAADLAVAVAYRIFGSDDPAAVAEAVVAGFEELLPLEAEERRAIPLLAAIRLCQTVVIGHARAARHPANAEYILADTRPAAAALLRLEAERGRAPATGSDELLERRRRVLAPGLRLSYDEPLHLVSGEGVWLVDAAGRRYLDAYNNVVQVGHGRPEIAAVLERETRRLNTNTRYLTEPVVELAERLTARLPAALDTCFFTCSGSEANDLALRIARTVTGREGVLVTPFAYHGSTTTVLAISPEELPDGPTAPWVETLPGPAGPFDATATQTAIDRLRTRDIEPAAVCFDPIFSSDGIFDLDPGFADATVAPVRAAGGLWIADEVQSGLGRVGRRFWGFAGSPLVPDLVTLGKPIGNGYPMGVVVATAAIASAFAERSYFFSTFGGNPVAAAVARTVLEITEREELAGRAETLGTDLRSRIGALAADDPRIRSVRGAGLFVGIELAAEGEVPGATARAVVEGMKARGVLVSRTGPRGDVLKIRPPLVFEAPHVGRLLSTLAETLAATAPR